MKFKQIEIENFKGISNITYNPKNKIGVLTGKNGTGKTSFVEAIRFGLTGDAPDCCITAGKDSTTVAITLDDGSVFSRTKYETKPTKVKVNGRTTPAKNLDNFLEENTGVLKEALKITTSAELLVSMKPDQFGTFLTSYIPEELDIDIVCDRIPALSIDARKVLEGYLPAAPNKFGTEKIQEAYSLIFEQRKYLKKDVEARKARIDAITITPPERSVELAENELLEITKAEGAQDAAKTAEHLYNTAVANKKAAEESLIELKRQIDSISATRPNPAERDSIEEEIRKINKTILNAQKMTATIDGTLRSLETTFSNLSSPFCPLSEKLLCTVDKTTVKDEIAELIQSNKEGLVVQRTIIEEAEKNLDELKEKKAAWEENEKKYKEKTFLASRYEGAKKNIPVLPNKPTFIEFVDYSATKKSLSQEIANCKAYEEKERLEKEMEELQKKCNIFDFLCKALDGKGEVMNSITSYYLSTFESVINDRADKLGVGFKVRFTSENGINYLIQTATSTEYHSYNSLSRGEQLLAIFLLLDMLNYLCGTRILILDDLNHLDANHFESLIQLIHSADVQDSYDHIFVCSTNVSEVEAVFAKITDLDRIF